MLIPLAPLGGQVSALLLSVVVAALLPALAVVGAASAGRATCRRRPRRPQAAER